jgi:hypothetical protein
MHQGIGGRDDSIGRVFPAQTYIAADRRGALRTARSERPETSMHIHVQPPSLAAAVGSGLRAGSRTTDLVIATVNNGHMIEMQKLTPHFEKANPTSSSSGSRSRKACCASASRPTSPPRAASST